MASASNAGLMPLGSSQLSAISYQGSVKTSHTTAKEARLVVAPFAFSEN